MPMTYIQYVTQFSRKEKTMYTNYTATISINYTTMHTMDPFSRSLWPLIQSICTLWTLSAGRYDHSYSQYAHYGPFQQVAMTTHTVNNWMNVLHNIFWAELLVVPCSLFVYTIWLHMMIVCGDVWQTTCKKNPLSEDEIKFMFRRTVLAIFVCWINNSSRFSNLNTQCPSMSERCQSSFELRL